MAQSAELLNIIELRSLPIFHQLQLEEALLRTSSDNYLLINSNSPPAIVVGISTNVTDVVTGPPPFPILRRFSGGGTVVVDEETLFLSFIGQEPLLGGRGLFPREIMTWSFNLLQPLFTHLDFRLNENDYGIGERKFGGNAQSITNGRFVHHSTLLWNYDSVKMNYLKQPPKMPIYRQNRSHRDFLCCLSEYFIDKMTWKRRLIETIEERYESQRLELASILPQRFKEHRKATRWLEWPADQI